MLCSGLMVLLWTYVSLPLSVYIRHVRSNRETVTLSTFRLCTPRVDRLNILLIATPLACPRLLVNTFTAHLCGVLPVNYFVDALTMGALGAGWSVVVS